MGWNLGCHILIVPFVHAAVLRVLRPYSVCVFPFASEFSFSDYLFLHLPNLILYLNSYVLKFSMYIYSLSLHPTISFFPAPSPSSLFFLLHGIQRAHFR